MENMSIRCNGFTLVELLVAMAVSGIVAAAIFTVFKSQQDSYIVQEDVAAMQQNLRAGMSMLSHDVRMAGHGPISWGGIKGIYIYNNNNNPDQIDIIYVDPSVHTTITQPMLSPTAVLDVDSTNDFFDNDLAIITDGNNASLLKITPVQGSKLKHKPIAGNINPPGGHNIFPSGGYASGSDVYKVRYDVSYRINTNDPLHPRLAINFYGPNGAGGYQPLANNIEAIGFACAYDSNDDGKLDTSSSGHILWAIDSNNDGQLDTLLDTNDDGVIDINDNPSGIALSNPVSIDQIRSVKIWLLARSRRPDRSYINKNTYVVANKRITPGDNYRRRLLVTTVTCRNMGL